MEYAQPYGATDPDAPYVDGDPSTGVAGSAVPAKAIEPPMRELVNLIEEAGITPDAEDLTQVAQAVLDLIGLHNVDGEAHADIRALIAAIAMPGQATETEAGLIELATSAEVATLTDGQRAVTPAGLGSVFGKSLAVNGYQKFPGGLILQWGNLVNMVTDAATAVTFPVAFPLVVYALAATASDTAAAFCSTSGHSVTGFDLHKWSYTGSRKNGAAWWVALGK